MPHITKAQIKQAIDAIVNIEQPVDNAVDMLESLLHLEETQPTVCLVGMRGSAFDLPETKRAYTYEEQPGNVTAQKLGAACSAANSYRAGDNIDRGLALLKELQKEGFGVFALGAEYAS